MNEINDLINVTFEDAVSYSPDAGLDVIGCPIEHCWGPVNTLQILNLTSFLNLYPEAHPIGALSTASIVYLYAWAQLRRAFKAGAGQVEVYRAQGSWLYTRWDLTYADPDHTLTASEEATQFSSEVTDLICIATKYPGRPPKTGIYADFVNLQVKVILGAVDEVPITIEVIGIDSDDAETVIETHYGSFDVDAVQDGQTYYIDNVLERDSKLVASQVNAIPVVPDAAETKEDDAAEFSAPTPVDSAAYVTAINAKYADPETSATTILLASLDGDDTLNDACAAIATAKKTCVFVVGFPTSTVLSSANVLSFITASLPAASYDKFTIFVAGNEIYKVLGKTMHLDCTGAWAGRVSQVATQFRINQLPSARTYGSFDGTLSSTLSFDEVLALHEVGVISVYTSNEGARIFGVRSRHPRQLSYYGKANISRVITRFLKSVFPEVLAVLHTEVVSDPTERARFDSIMNGILNEFIAAGNIKDESSVDVSNVINDDEQTNGGETLNINISLWFKKLTEKVNIKIIATDSSVTATIN